MKTQTTNKAIRNRFNNIIKIGYCELQRLLYFKNAEYYNAGVYGWNSDFYVVDNAVICTGYRPIGKDTDYKLVKEYNDKADVILSNYDLTVDEQKAKIDILLSEFIEKATK